MRLPIEVLEGFIDQACDSPTSLRHLSLTCAEFLPRARYHLFASIVIQTREQIQTSPDFFDAHPWLLPLVHKVTLANNREGNSEDVPDKHDAYLLEGVPVHLLTCFPNLRMWNMQSFPSSNRRPSFHRYALRGYQMYSSRIHHLELFGIRFDVISDFAGLVSAFKNIHTLTCSRIDFEKMEENDSFKNTLKSRSLQVSALQVGTDVNICAVEYLLAYCPASLNNLHLDIWKDKYDSEFFERLERSMRLLSRLSSLTFQLSSMSLDRDPPTEVLHSFARIVGGVEGTPGHLRDVRVTLNFESIGDFGCHLSHPGPSLEACKALEKALLVIPDSHILVDCWRPRRAGRFQLWSSAIERAFPRLNERGLLTLTSTKPDTPDRPGHEYEVTGLVASHDSKWIATASTDGTIIVWDTSSGAVLQEWFAHGDGVKALALSPDSRRLLSAGACTLIVWAIDDAVQKVAELEGPTDTVVSCTWSPDGALVASGSEDGAVRIWNGDTLQQCDLLLDPDRRQTSQLHFSPNSRHLAWISGHDCCIWRPLIGQQPTRLRFHPDDHSEVDTYAISFDPDSRRIATAHGAFNAGPDTCAVRIWDVVNGASLVVLSGHSKPATSILFSLDGNSLLSTSIYDRSTRVWDADSGEQTGLLQTDDMTLACFSPDGKHIAYGRHASLGRLCRMDDLNGCSVAEFVDYTCRRDRMLFSPNGQFLISAYESGGVHIRPFLNIP